MARHPRKLPPLDLAALMETYPTLRQSLLARSDECLLSTRFALEGSEYSNAAASRGIVGHRAIAEVLRTLWRTGEISIPVAEALEVLYEQAAQRDVPDEEVVVLTARERLLLRQAIVKLVSDNTFGMSKLIDVERRLYATVRYPDPLTGEAIERAVTGRLDALLMEPPDGAVVLDWKFWRQAPPAYRGDKETDVAAGLSYEGFFQLRVYAFLVLTEYPTVQQVRLREFYPLEGVARTALVKRTQMEHIERELSVVVELLDRAIQGGSDSPLWRPTPGKHCSFCPRPQSCPISQDERISQGGITSHAQASRAAAEYVVTDRVRTILKDALSSWSQIHGPVEVRSGRGRYALGWWPTKTGRGRRFGLKVPARSDRGPEDPNLAAAFAEAAERKRSA